MVLPPAIHVTSLYTEAGFGVTARNEIRTDGVHSVRAFFLDNSLALAVKRPGQETLNFEIGKTLQRAAE